MDFIPISAIVGGALIGLAAATLLLANGRTAGISTILGDALQQRGGAWRWWFLGGLLAGGAVLLLAHPEAYPATLPFPAWTLAGAGVLVGFGSRLGGGCTSGHGVCGIARLSARSLVATLTFMTTGALTVYLVHHVLAGGAS